MDIAYVNVPSSRTSFNSLKMRTLCLLFQKKKLTGVDEELWWTENHFLIVIFLNSDDNSQREKREKIEVCKGKNMDSAQEKCENAMIDPTII